MRQAAFSRTGGMRDEKNMQGRKKGGKIFLPDPYLGILGRPGLYGGLWLVLCRASDSGTFQCCGGGGNLLLPGSAALHDTLSESEEVILKGDSGIPHG